MLFEAFTFYTPVPLFFKGITSPLQLIWETDPIQKGNRKKKIFLNLFNVLNMFHGNRKPVWAVSLVNTHGKGSMLNY